MNPHTLFVRCISAVDPEWSSPVVNARFWNYLYKLGYTSRRYNGSMEDSFSKKYGIVFFDFELEVDSANNNIDSEFSNIVDEQGPYINQRINDLKEIINTKEYKFLVFDGVYVFNLFQQKLEVDLCSSHIQFGEMEKYCDARVFVFPSISRSSDRHWLDNNGKKLMKKFIHKLNYNFRNKEDHVLKNFLILVLGSILLLLLLLVIQK